MIKLKNYSFKERLYLYYFPLFNAIMFATVNLFSDDSNISVFRGGVSILIIIYFLITQKRISWDPPTILVLLFALDIIIMGGINYLRYHSFEVKVLKVLISGFFYLFSYHFVRDIRTFHLAIAALYHSLFIVIISIIILNILGVTPSQSYGIDFNLGSQGVNTTKIIPILLLPLIYFLINFKLRRKQKLLMLSLLILGIVFILIGMKRGAIFGLSVALLIYLIFNSKKIKSSRYVILTILLFLILSPLFLDKIQESYQIRQDRYTFTGEEDLEEEARYMEMNMVINDIRNKSVFRVFFGEGLGSEFLYYDTYRMFHTDYFSILHGAGVLGLFLYLYFYFWFLNKLIFHLRIPKNNSFNILLYDTKIVLISIIFLGLILAISGFYHIIGLRAFLLFFMGSGMALISKSGIQSKYTFLH